MTRKTLKPKKNSPASSNPKKLLGKKQQVDEMQQLIEYEPRLYNLQVVTDKAINCLRKKHS